MNTDGIEYDIVYSSRRTIGVQVKTDRTVCVRAPFGTAADDIEKAVRDNAGWIRKHLEKMNGYAEKYPEPTDEEKQELINRAKEILPGKVRHYAALMGVVPERVTITGAKTRFGSCSGKNTICFSYLLMRYPEEAVDYVVVHELAHIKHHDHSPAFWAEVAKYMPDHKRRRKMLR